MQFDDFEKPKKDSENYETQAVEYLEVTPAEDRALVLAYLALAATIREAFEVKKAKRTVAKKPAKKPAKAKKRAKKPRPAISTGHFRPTGFPATEKEDFS